MDVSADHSNENRTTFDSTGMAVDHSRPVVIFFALIQTDSSYDSRLSTQTPACAGGNLDGQQVELAFN